MLTIPDIGAASSIPFPDVTPRPAYSSPSKPVHFPRATSEPPPDTAEDGGFELSLPSPSEVHPSSPRRPQHRHQPSDAGAAAARLGLSLTQPPDEYMWEWGAFPQRSPIVENFEPRGMRAAKARWKGKGREALDVHELTRAQSEPPEVDEGERTTRVIEAPVSEDARGGSGVLGAGGRLIKDRAHPGRMGVWVDNRTVWFELAVVPMKSLERVEGKRKGALGGLEEVEAAEVFEQGQITLERFLDDESVLNEDGLVLRWSDDR